jgi:DNA-binding LytR/AlgR family response regulator
MKVLIVEDEPLAAERLQLLLLQTDPAAQVIGVLDSIEEVVNFFNAGGKPDLLFLDIELSDGRSFAIFDRITINIPVIFTTAYDQYALDAFQFLSIDYLLKPLEAESLRRALSKFNRLSNGVDKNELQILRERLDYRRKNFKERFVIRAGNKLQFKTTRDVAYFFADGKMVYLVTKVENRKYLVDHTLEEIEQMVDPDCFFRISRKFIICVDALYEVKTLLSGKLEIRMNQGCEHDLSVSRERAGDFKVWLNR